MADSLATVPRLVATGGRLAHVTWNIPDGRSTIGRDRTTVLVVDDDSVSRLHAELSRNGDHVVLSDLRSTNGTWVNGRRLQAASQELHAGDAVTLGHVQMSFVVPAATGRGQQTGVRPGNRFGDVHGPVNAGSGHQNVGGGTQYNAGGGMHVGDRHDYRYSNDYEPADELFQGKGFGRVLMALGMVLAFGGFGLFAYVIFVGFGSDINDPIGQSPFAVEIAPGVPMLPVGFGAFLIGGILAGIGGGMSKAARKRAERRDNRGYHR